MGKVEPVSMRLISSGEWDSHPMTHFSPTLCTQVPTLEAMAATQITRNRRLRSGANGERESDTGLG